MRILLIHQNFPGQFRHVAPVWARRPGWQVMAIGRDTCPGLPDVPEIKLIRYRPHRDGFKEQHPYLRKMEDAVLHGQAVARVLQGLKQPQPQRQVPKLAQDDSAGQGGARGASAATATSAGKAQVTQAPASFTPDVILAHPGWGETLYAKDIFPHARLIHLCEWYYNPRGADVNFDPEFPAALDEQLRIRTWNALHLLNLEQCDAAISPTQWQRAQHPRIYHPKIQVAHEGINTDALGPDPEAMFTVPARPVQADRPISVRTEHSTPIRTEHPTPVRADHPTSVRAEHPTPVRVELVEARQTQATATSEPTPATVRAEPVEAPQTLAPPQAEPVEAPMVRTSPPAPDPITLKAGDPVITYVSRNLEPYRGFHQFMRALEIIQREHPTAQTLIVGGDDVSYGKRPPSHGGAAAANWRTVMLNQCRIDTTRTHFLGRVPYEQYKKILQISAAHVYLTVPFVLSWSMLEAMATGCLVIASNTPPVREVIEDGVNGLLVDFFNPQDIARQVLHSLQEPRLGIPLRRAARTAVQQRFHLRAGITAYEALLKNPHPLDDDLRHPHQRVPIRR